MSSAFAKPAESKIKSAAEFHAQLEKTYAHLGNPDVAQMNLRNKAGETPAFVTCKEVNVPFFIHFMQKGNMCLVIPDNNGQLPYEIIDRSNPMSKIVLTNKRQTHTMFYNVVRVETLLQAVAFGLESVVSKLLDLDPELIRMTSVFNGAAGGLSETAIKSLRGQVESVWAALETQQVEQKSESKMV